MQHNTSGTDYNVLGFNNTINPSDDPDNKIFIWPGKLDSDELYNATEKAADSYYSVTCLANDIEQYDYDDNGVASLRTINKFPLTITKKENEKNEEIFSIEYTDTNGKATLDNITNIECNGFGVSDIEMLKSLG